MEHLGVADDDELAGGSVRRRGAIDGRKLALHQHRQRVLLAAGWRLQVVGAEIGVAGHAPGSRAGGEQNGGVKAAAVQNVGLQAQSAAPQVEQRRQAAGDGDRRVHGLLRNGHVQRQVEGDAAADQGVHQGVGVVHGHGLMVDVHQHRGIDRDAVVPQPVVDFGMLRLLGNGHVLTPQRVIPAVLLDCQKHRLACVQGLAQRQLILDGQTARVQHRHGMRFGRDALGKRLETSHLVALARQQAFQHGVGILGRGQRAAHLRIEFPHVFRQVQRVARRHQRHQRPGVAAQLVDEVDEAVFQRLQVARQQAGDDGLGPVRVGHADGGVDQPVDDVVALQHLHREGPHPLIQKAPLHVGHGRGVVRRRGALRRTNHVSRLQMHHPGAQVALAGQAHVVELVADVAFQVTHGDGQLLAGGDVQADLHGVRQLPQNAPRGR